MRLDGVPRASESRSLSSGTRSCSSKRPYSLCDAGSASTSGPKQIGMQWSPSLRESLHLLKNVIALERSRACNQNHFHGSAGGRVRHEQRLALTTILTPHEDPLRQGRRSGGAVLDLSVQDFDVPNWIFGVPKSVFARGRELKPGLVTSSLPCDHIFVWSKTRPGFVTTIRDSRFYSWRSSILICRLRGVRANLIERLAARMWSPRLESRQCAMTQWDFEKNHLRTVFGLRPKAERIAVIVQ